MASIYEILGVVADEALQRNGVRVYIKTDLGPPLEIYNSDSPSSDTPAPVKAGVIITNRAGDVLGNVGDIPETNIIKQLAVGGTLLLGASLLIRGVWSFIK